MELFTSADWDLLIGILVLTGIAIVLFISYLIVLWLRGTHQSSSVDAEQTEPHQRPASPDTASTVRPLSEHMRRFLSIVEHELDAEENLEEDEQGKIEQKPEGEEGKRDDKQLDDSSHKLPATSIVAVEVRTAAEAGQSKDAGVEGDEAGSDDEESGSRLVVIDKTRLVPEVDVENFVS